MDVTVILVTGESIEGKILEESDGHIVLGWKNGKKVSVLAKEHIKKVLWVEVEF